MYAAHRDGHISVNKRERGFVCDAAKNVGKFLAFHVSRFMVPAHGIEPAWRPWGISAFLAGLACSGHSLLRGINSRKKDMSGKRYKRSTISLFSHILDAPLPQDLDILTRPSHIRLSGTYILLFHQLHAFDQLSPPAARQPSSNCKRYHGILS